MKRILYILSAVLIIAGCGSKEGDGAKSLSELICGEWHSTSLSVGGDVYLDFNEDKTFEMYQKIGEGAYRLYRGEWDLEEDILTGKYNDGENWAASYEASIDGQKLTLTSNNDAAEKTEYASCTIPEEVKSKCETVVKSDEGGL